LLLKNVSNPDTDADTFAAFLALGGTEDEDSYIDADLLIDTIRNKFKLTIDIEKLIEVVDNVCIIPLIARTNLERSNSESSKPSSNPKKDLKN